MDSRHRKLETAYRQAIYRVELPADTYTLRIGESCPGLDQALADSDCGLLCILTAHNPCSQALTSAENRQRGDALTAAVRRAGLRSWPATNLDPAGQWPEEPGLCIANLPPRLLDTWLVRFGQNAAVVYETATVPRLVWHPALRTDGPRPAAP